MEGEASWIEVCIQATVTFCAILSYAGPCVSSVPFQTEVSYSYRLFSTGGEGYGVVRFVYVESSALCYRVGGYTREVKVLDFMRLPGHAKYLRDFYDSVQIGKENILECFHIFCGHAGENMWSTTFRSTCNQTRVARYIITIWGCRVS